MPDNVIDATPAVATESLPDFDKILAEDAAKKQAEADKKAMEEAFPPQTLEERIEFLERLLVTKEVSAQLGQNVEQLGKNCPNSMYMSMLFTSRRMLSMLHELTVRQIIRTAENPKEQGFAQLMATLVKGIEGAVNDIQKRIKASAVAEGPRLVASDGKPLSR